MLYPLSQAIYYVTIIIVILLTIGFTLRAYLARFIGRTHAQMKNAHKDVLKEYQSGREEEEH